MLLNKIKETNQLISSKQEADSINIKLAEYSKSIDRLKTIKKNVNNYTISLIKLKQIDSIEFQYDDLNKIIS